MMTTDAIENGPENDFVTITKEEYAELLKAKKELEEAVSTVLNATKEYDDGN